MLHVFVSNYHFALHQCTSQACLDYMHIPFKSSAFSPDQIKCKYTYTLLRIQTMLLLVQHVHTCMHNDTPHDAHAHIHRDVYVSCRQIYTIIPTHTNVYPTCTHNYTYKLIYIHPYIWIILQRITQSISHTVRKVFYKILQ